MSIKYFEYGNKEIDYLSSKDEKFKKAIKDIGIIKREVNPNIYQSIVRSIVGQQISTAVQNSIMNRLVTMFPSFDAKSIALASDEDLRSLGLSTRKVTYIKEFSQKVFKGELDLDKLKTLSDDEVTNILTSLKGIGPWTAEMTLLFSLQRPNIFSFGDLAVKRGLQNLYGYETVTKEIFEHYRKLFSPYGSVASLYLWELSK